MRVVVVPFKLSQKNFPLILSRAKGNKWEYVLMVLSGVFLTGPLIVHVCVMYFQLDKSISPVILSMFVIVIAIIASLHWMFVRWALSSRGARFEFADDAISICAAGLRIGFPMQAIDYFVCNESDVTFPLTEEIPERKEFADNPYQTPVARSADKGRRLGVKFNIANSIGVGFVFCKVRHCFLPDKWVVTLPFLAVKVGKAHGWYPVMPPEGVDVSELVTALNTYHGLPVADSQDAMGTEP